MSNPASAPISPDVLRLLDQISQPGKNLQNGHVSVREKLLGKCRAFISDIPTPRETLLMIGWVLPTYDMVLWMAIHLKLFEALAEDDSSLKSRKEIADACKAEPLFVLRMLKGLAAMGSVKEVDAGRCASTPFAKAIADAPFQDALVLIPDPPSQPQSTPILRTKSLQEPGDRNDGLFQYTPNCKGRNVFQCFAQIPEIGKRVGIMMGVWTQGRPDGMDEQFYPIVERLIEESKQDEDAILLVDVGGGRGHDLQSLEANHQNIKGEIESSGQAGGCDAGQIIEWDQGNGARFQHTATS